jgi:F0F1-type ATP synthase assembly protein I
VKNPYITSEGPFGPIDNKIKTIETEIEKIKERLSFRASAYFIAGLVVGVPLGYAWAVMAYGVLK